MYALLATLPILVVAVFLVGLRWPASRVMPLSLVTAALLAYFVWETPGWQVAAFGVKGALIAVDLLYIIFGAILLLNTLQQSGAISVDSAGVSIRSRPTVEFRRSSLPGCLVRSSKERQALELRRQSRFRCSLR